MADDNKPTRIPPSTSPMADPIPGGRPRVGGRFIKKETAPAPETEIQGADALAGVAGQLSPSEAAPPPLPTGDRVPFGGQRRKLHVRPRAGFKQRIFNDVPGRIDDALRAGYIHVLDAKGIPVKFTVGRGDGGIIGYAMEIPEQFYNEDFAKKQDALDFTDEQIYGGTFNEEAGDNRYVPRNTMNMRVERGSGRR